MVLVHLLHQRLHGWLLFLKDRLHLTVLIAGQIKLPEHVVEVAAKTVRALRNRDCRRQQHSSADDENAFTS